MTIRKVYLVLILFLAAFASAEGFEEFEKSLMQQNSGETSGTVNAFEQSLMQDELPEMSLAYRGREALLQAVKSGDTAAISQKIAELDNMKSDRVVPLVNVEKEIIYIDKGMWHDLLKLEVSYYRSLFDSLDVENAEYPENDALMFYVKEKISGFDETRPMYSQISHRIDKAQMDEADKLELEIVLLLKSCYSKSGVVDLVAELSRKFCEKYPDHPDAKWIEKSILEPAKRANYHNLVREYRANYIKMRSENKEENIRRNLYTGGFGTNVFLFSGGLAFGDELYRSDYVETEGIPFNLEFYLQIKRFALIAEILPSGITDVFSYSFGLGFVAFDSRYLKVRPYLAYGIPAVMLESKAKLGSATKRKYLYEGEDDLFFGEHNLTLAVDVDFRFLTAYLFKAMNHFFGMSLVGKFGVSYISFDEAPFINGENVSPFFSLGFGVFFW